MSEKNSESDVQKTDLGFLEIPENVEYIKKIESKLRMVPNPVPKQKRINGDPDLVPEKITYGELKRRLGEDLIDSKLEDSLKAMELHEMIVIEERSSLLSTVCLGKKEKKEMKEIEYSQSISFTGAEEKLPDWQDYSKK